MGDLVKFSEHFPRSACSASRFGDAEICQLSQDQRLSARLLDIAEKAQNEIDMAQFMHARPKEINRRGEDLTAALVGIIPSSHPHYDDIVYGLTQGIRSAFRQITDSEVREPSPSEETVADYFKQNMQAVLSAAVVTIKKGGDPVIARKPVVAIQPL